MTITVEISPGTSIETAFNQAKALAKKLDISVKFKFNGVSCLAFAKGTTEKGVASWNKAMGVMAIKIASNI